MSNINLESLTSQMKVMADMASGQLNSKASLPAAGEPDFESALKKAVLAVNETQNVAQAKVQSFSTGQSNITMIAVRNRLVDAYKEVTNLQV